VKYYPIAKQVGMVLPSLNVVMPKNSILFSTLHTHYNYMYILHRFEQRVCDSCEIKRNVPLLMCVLLLGPLLADSMNALLLLVNAGEWDRGVKLVMEGFLDSLLFTYFYYNFF